MLLKNATIITMNPTRDILRDGAIAINEQRIVGIGKTETLLAQYQDEDVLDVQDKLIIPGLIDTHVHVVQALICGCADNMALIQWLCERVWVFQGNFTQDDGYVSARLCIAEMLKSGTTTFLESMLAHRYGFDGIARTVEESGIRACLAGIVMDIGTYATQANAMHPGLIEEPRNELTGCAGDAQQMEWVSTSTYSCLVWSTYTGGVSPELYREMSVLARQHNMGITMHWRKSKPTRYFYRKNMAFRLARTQNGARAHGLADAGRYCEAGRDTDQCLAQPILK